MIADHPSPDELSRLLSALEDGLLDAAGQQRLQELLQSDPQARAQYYDHVMLAALLRREGRRAAAGQTPMPQEGASDEPVATVIRRRRASRAWLVALAASVLLAVGLTIGEATGVTQVMPTIVRIVTGEGSLLIEVDDPSVSVTLDGDEVRITGAGVHELRLRPGEHKFVATRDGRPLRDEVVTIERGGRRVVKVSRLPAGTETTELTKATGGSTASSAGVPSSLSLHCLTHGQPVYAVAFSGPGRVLSGSWDHTVRLWDAERGREIHRFDLRLPGRNHAIFCVAASADNRRGLAGSRDGRVWLLDLEQGRVLSHCDHPRTKERSGYGVNSVAMSADGRQALLGSYDGVVRVWDAGSWREERRFQHAFGLWSVAYSHDEQRAATAGGIGPDVAVCLWKLDDGQQLARLEAGPELTAGYWRVVFSPDDKRIAGGCHDKSVHIWSAATGQRERSLAHGGVVAGVCFTPDGKRLVTGCYDTVVRVWDVETGRELHRLVGHTGVVQSVAVSPDGKLAASASLDGTLRIWKLPDH